MANVTLTHKVIARESAKLFSEEAPFLMNINLGRQSEFGVAMNGYKVGDNVDIRIPSVGRVYSGPVFAEGGAALDNVEQKVNLKLDLHRHVPLQFGAVEKVLELTDLRERILRPQMRMLSSALEAEFIQRAYLSIPNIVGTPGTLPTTMKVYGQARAKLQAELTPPSDRSTLFSSDAQLELVDASKALFHQDKAIETGYLRGTIGDAVGTTFYEHQSMPTHTNGTQNMSVMLLNGAPAEGATSVAIDTGTGTQTITEGTIITMAGAFSIHPLTGVAYPFLRQFRVTETTALVGGAGTIGIYPALRASAPNKTVSALPLTDAAITMVGAASTSYRQNIMFQKDAFTAGFAPLPVLAGCEGYTARLPNGVSVTVQTFGDGTNFFERTRIDVLGGFAAPQPLFAVRITE